MGAWCTVTVIGPDGLTRTTWSLRGPGEPTLCAVDVLARLQLTERRRGAHLVVTDVCQALSELLDLAGLTPQLGGQDDGPAAAEQ